MDYLKEKKELVSIVLLCLSAVLVLSILVKIASFSTAPAKAAKIVKAADEQNTKEVSDIDKYFAQYKKQAEDLKQKNLFAPPAPRQHPVREVAGIFGDEVIINERLYKVGDKIGDAKLISIEPTSVTIEWDGKKQTFSPMDSKDPSQGGNSRGPRQTAKEKTPEGEATLVTIQSQAKQMGISDVVIEKMAAKLQNMNQEEKKQFDANMKLRTVLSTMSKEEIKNFERKFADREMPSKGEQIVKNRKKTAENKKTNN